MKAKLFIDRPILASCISAMLIMLGLIGLSQLPMEEYPEIAPPTIVCRPPIPGANASTLQKR